MCVGRGETPAARRASARACVGRTITVVTPSATPLAPDAILLTGRVALVTGAARGIGRATAEALARFGADVAICDRDRPGLAETAGVIEAAGRRVHVGELDVRDRAAVDGFVADAASDLGPLHVVVNNAGGGFFAEFLDVSVKGQAALVDENFSSVTHVIRAVVPVMASDGGAIVNVTSVEAHRAGPGFAVYSAMKAAVANLTKSLAMELADRRIRVNCVAPDMIPTPGDAGLAAESAAMEVERSYDMKPLPYDGHVDDCAAAVVYLAGDLGRFVTGTTVHVDGGTHAAGGWRRRHDGGFVL